jgi:hypothetical protein
MLGYCPVCEKQIFEIKNGKLGRPLGNYRSLKLQLKDSRNMVVPICMVCHESFKLTDDFLVKLFKYLKDTAPAEWDEVKRISYAKRYTSLEIVGFKKQGCLSQKDLKEGQVIQ